MDQSKILQALDQVPDPVTGQGLLKTMRITDLKVEPPRVWVSLALPGIGEQEKSRLNFACIEAVQKLYPEADVHIHLTTEKSAAAAIDKAVPHVRHILAVASGKGGVGKSTVSVNLALALKELGLQVGLLDADLYGPSIPTMLGLKGQRPQLRKLYDRPRLVPLDYEGMPVMSIGFIVEPEQAVVLRGPRLGGIIKQFFNEVLWPPLDYLVVDLPPGTGDIQLTLVQTAALTGALIVTTPQEVAVADAVKAMNMFRHPSVKVPVLGVVENMSWFTPKELPENRYFIFGQGGGAKLADQGNVPLLGQIPLILGIREGGDEGRPAMTQDDPLLRRPFLDLAEKVLERVRWREENLEPTQPVQVSR